MVKKKIVKVAKASSASSSKIEKRACCNICTEKKWSLVPLRFALGLMFLAAGLPKLFSLIGGGNQIPMFFTGLGIPAAGFFAWLVAILEVAGGIFLLLGFLTWWTGLVLGIILVVALITTTLSPFNWGQLTKHLVYISALMAVMWAANTSA